MEVKKAKWLKFISAIAIFMVMIFCTGLNVHAEEVKDGISVTVSSDKENYSSEDEVKLKITVKNTNDFEVSNIKIENILPDGISLVSGDLSKDNINLKANEEHTIDLSVKKANTEQTNIVISTTKNVIVTGKNDSPKTGENDTPFIALIVMLISTVIMIICFWKGRKKHIKFLSLFLCFGVVGTFGITGVIHATSTSNNSFTYEYTYKIDSNDYVHKVVVSYNYNTNNDFDYYYDIEVEVDKEIDDVLHSTNLSINEKKEKILNILYKFEKEKKIVEGSIEYMENEKTICFQYLDGLDCIIELEERVSGFSGIANKDQYVAEYKYYDKETGKFFEYYDSINNEFQILDIPAHVKNDIDFSNSSYPFPEEEIRKLDLTAKYMYGLCDLSINCDYCKYLSSYQTYQKKWNNNHLRTDIDTYCTVEDFKTGLCGYDIVFIEEHGTFAKKETYILTCEKYDKESRKKYKSDDKNLAKSKQTGSNNDYWVIRPSFFEKYYSNDKLKNTIIWIGSCKGYMHNDLVDIFERCGASAVIGYNDTVNTNYDNVLHGAFVYSLMHGDTALEALEFAKDIWKPDDRTYFYSYIENKVEEFGCCGTIAKINPNGENTKLIYLPYYGRISGIVKDENNNPIQNAKISIHNIRGASYEITATTNKNGEYTLECPQDSYKIGVKADGYEYFETDSFIPVSYNNITSFSITLKKEIEPTTPDNNDIIAEGICGDNLTWVLDNKGRLTIKGTGEMYDYTDMGVSWREYRKDIKDVAISDDVTYIGENAFAYCENLENINLPDGLTIISNSCFKGCKSLKSISIPESVTKLGLSAFNDCEQLTNIKLPDNLKEIGWYAFNGCTNLIDIVIPESVEVLGNGAFMKCSKLKSIIIPNSIKNISSDTFAYCTSLTSITIAKDVEIGGKNVFYKTPNVVIYGYSETPAEKYANNNNIPFVELNNNNEQETTEDLIIETVTLTNNDIKPEWEHVTSLNLEYPVFKSKDTELQDFLTASVTEKILSYMQVDKDYNIGIYGSFKYDMSINGYLSVSAYIANHAEGGNGAWTIPYTFFIDLKNKQFLSLSDLFTETEDEIYKEVAIKADKYNKSHAQHDTLLNYNYKECKFTITKDNLILTFNPYSISSGADGIINIEIPLIDLDLTCKIL